MSRHRPHWTADRAIAAVTVAAILVGCSSWKFNPPPARGTGVEKFGRLQEGMTREQAKAVLGGAGKYLGSPKCSVAATLWQWKGEGWCVVLDIRDEKVRGGEFYQTHADAVGPDKADARFGSVSWMGP